MVRTAAPLALLLLGCYAAAPTTAPTTSQSERPAIPSGPRVGQPAPPVEGVDADGRTVRLSDFRGKVVLIDFWQTQ
jgi:cytochrome oxidase Cu insertion factor (SCO1/SenC/PrrC family)